MAGAIDVPACILFHSSMPYLHEGASLGVHPCMLAPLIDSTGRLLAWHRTYLTRDGHKADVPTVRKLTSASGLLSGSCIPLAAPEGGRLGIAEGIETALGASFVSGVPTVAAYSAGNLAAWRFPRDVHSLVIFGDNDPAGRKAAADLQERAEASRLNVKTCTPAIEGEDWCDVWAKRAEVSA